MNLEARLAALSPAERQILGADWTKAAHQGQKPPESDWRTWLVLGGRGGGKTRAGAEWVANRARDGSPGGGRIALVGQSLHDVREVMIEGPSGLCALPRYAIGGRPQWEASRRRLVWPNGAVAMVFSAEDPESLRGPQFGAAWADEWCAWRKPEATLALLRMGLRLGRRPQLVVTTTPKPMAALRRLLKEAGLERTDLPTRVNAGNLAPAYLEGLEDLYGGTRLAAQELDGRVVEGDGALFTLEMMQAARQPSLSPLWGGTASPKGEPGWGAKGPERGHAGPTLSSLRADIPPVKGRERPRLPSSASSWPSIRRARPGATPAGSWSRAGRTAWPGCWPTGRCAGGRRRAGPGSWRGRSRRSGRFASWPIPTRAGRWSRPC